MKIVKKIVFVLPSIKIGGGNRVILELANELVLDGIEVDVVYPMNSKDQHTFIVSNKINFIEVGQQRNSRLYKLINLFKTFTYLNKNYKETNIVLTDPLMSLFIPLIKKNKIHRFIQASDYNIFDDLYILKNIIFLKIYKQLTKLSYKLDVNYIFNSKFTYENFLKVSAREDVKLKLVHPAVNHMIFNNQNMRENNKMNVCLIARKHPMKGFLDFLEPFNSGQISGIDSVYVLSHDNLSEFDLSNVILVEPKSDEEIAHYMNKSHIFISTSWWEGFGLPPLEAMACGCAVVLSDAGGVDEYAIKSQNCLIYEPRNKNDLIRHVEYLIQHDDKRREIRKEAIVQAANFSWNHSKNQFLKVINATT